MNRIQRILVPIDFSNASEEALEYATQLSRSNGARIEVLHVYEVPHLFRDADLEIPETGGGTSTVRRELRHEAQKSLEQALERWREKGIEPSEARVEEGAAALVIVEEAEERGHDLIVMGTRGRGLGAFLIGSVAERVVRHAPCPVLTVRATVKSSNQA